MAVHYPCDKRLVGCFKLLKHEQGLNKLPRTHGAWMEHMRRPRKQANVCSRDVVLNTIIPKSLDPG